MYDYVIVTHWQTESANINKTMFESDTPCRRSEHNVSNVVTQPTCDIYINYF